MLAVASHCRTATAVFLAGDPCQLQKQTHGQAHLFSLMSALRSLLRLVLQGVNVRQTAPRVMRAGWLPLRSRAPPTARPGSAHRPGARRPPWRSASPGASAGSRPRGGARLVCGFEAADLSLIGFAKRLAETALEVLLRLAPHLVVVLAIHAPEAGTPIRWPQRVKHRALGELGLELLGIEAVEGGLQRRAHSRHHSDLMRL